MCIKGFTATELLDHPDRLTTPLVRDARDARSRPRRWDDALDLVAERLPAHRRRAHGPDGVGAFGSGALTNEKAYLLGKFARVALRTPQHRLQRPLLHVVGGRRPEPGLRRSTAACRSRSSDIAEADVLLLVGREPRRDDAAAHAVISTQRPRARRRHVVVDPRAHGDRARRATCTCSRRPAPTCALANGLLHLAIAEDLVDQDYIAARTDGFDARAARAVRLLAGPGRAHHRRRRSTSYDARSQPARRAPSRA